jgi:hypothetical protein
MNEHELIDEIRNLKRPEFMSSDVRVIRNDIEIKIESSPITIKMIIPSMVFPMLIGIILFTNWKTAGFSWAVALQLLPAVLFLSIFVGVFIIAIQYIESLRIKAGPLSVISNYNLSNYLGSSISVSKIRSIVDVYFTTKRNRSRSYYRVIFAVHDEGCIPILWQSVNRGSGCRPKAVDIANLFQVTHQKVLLGDIKM